MKFPITGTRVYLRKLTKTDSKAIHSLAQDREISRNTFMPYPFAMDNALKLIKYFQLVFRKKTSYGFGIEERQSGSLAGVIFISNLNLRHKKAEIAYWLGKDYRGKGLMSDALQLLLRFTFRELKLNRVTAYVFPENTGSYVLLEKGGFTREGLLRDYVIHRRRRKDCLVYSILKEEWVAKR
jgi:ribosomal-protein-alanine N-acetyltransferase